jgi:FtsH-binding integral membrane protein
MDITSLAKINLASGLASSFKNWVTATEERREQLKVWAVFMLCLVFSGIGVAISFLAFGTNITGIKKWGIGLVIAIVMLGISYGAKYANNEARKTFTPVDLIQYLSQGFLWPSTWPALADFLGIQKVISPPQTSSQLFYLGERFVAFILHLPIS